MADSSREIAELAREAQLRQLGSLDSLDSKAATLVGFAGVLLGLVFSSPIATDDWNLGLSFGAGVTIAAILYLTLALVPRRYKTNPNTFALAAAYMDKEPAETHEVVVESINRGIAFNADRLRSKAFRLQVGAVLLLIGFITMGVSLIYTVERRDAQQPTPQAQLGHPAVSTDRKAQK